MNKIAKALQRLSVKERKVVREILERIEKDNLYGLDVMKLKGRVDIFRVRKGDLRIIYRKRESQKLILVIERRAEKTYKKL